MYSLGNTAGFGWGSGCYSGCCSYPISCGCDGFGFGGSGFSSNAAIILVLFILLVIILGCRFIGPAA